MRADIVFFDAGYTLLYPDPPVGEVYADALRQAGVEADPQEVHSRFVEACSSLRRRRNAGTLDIGSGEGDGREWWCRVVQESFAPYGPIKDFDAVFERLWDYFAGGEAWRLYADVKPTLAALREYGKRVGLISNWDRRLQSVLADMGLDRQLDVVVISHLVGTEKPGPAIFHHALQMADVSPECATHVGDSYEEDVVGAQQVGMGAIWLRRDSDRQRARSVPTVGSLREVPDLLR